MNNMANSYYGFTGGGPYGNLTGTYLQPTFQATALPAVAAVANSPTAYIQPFQTVYAAATPQLQAYDPYASPQAGLTATPYYSAMGAQVLPVPAAASAFGAAPTYESYYAPLAGASPAVQQLVYTVPQMTNNAALQMAKLQQVYDPTKRYLQATVPTSYYSMNSDAGYNTLTMAPKPLYIATSYATPLPQRQNVTIKTYNVQPVALTPSMLAPVPLAPTIHDNLAAAPASAVRGPSSAVTVHLSPAASTSVGLEVPGSTSITSSLNSMYSRSKISSMVGNTCTSRSNSTSGSLTITCTGTSSGGSSGTIVPLGRQIEKTALSISGKSSSRSLQLQYCDICKISCAGSQAYREHLDGQKHKRKEASSKSTTPGSSTYRAPLHCDVCSVTCTSADMYAAHLRSSRHQRFLKLHAKPAMSSPTMPGSCSASEVSKGVMAASKNSAVNNSDSKSSTTFRLILSNSGRRSHDEKGNQSDAEDSDGSSSDVQPVGVEFVEDICNENGVASSFVCKLCDCKFTDPFAKIMHTKGKRHRFMYKKKIDPNVKAEGLEKNIKSGGLERKTKSGGGSERKTTSSSKLYLEDKWKLECDQRRYEEGAFLGAFFLDGVPAAGKAIPPGRRPDSFNDRHVMARHNSIYPTETQLEVIQSLVVACEKGLKLVSEHLSERNTDGSSTTSIKGVMRVGLVAKGLLLQGDNMVHLVVLCAEKPTRSLLTRVVDALSKHLVSVSSTRYLVDLCVEEAGCIVTREDKPKASCVIMMTSPIIREQLLSVAAVGDMPDTLVPRQRTGSMLMHCVLESVAPVADPPDVLDRQKCLEALALLRHAKWFQARASGFQSCVIVIRVLRDLCQREPTWRHLPEWALELLVEKCISSAGHSLSPGEAFRRVIECVSAGLLLPGGPGLMDPCEKEPTDAAGSMTKQEREDFTATAQGILRRLAFCQIFRVLDMEKLARNASIKRHHSADLIPGNEEESSKKTKTEESDK